MEYKDIKAELSEKLEANYIFFMRECMKLEPLKLIEKAEKIAATKLVFEENGSEMVHDDEMPHVSWSIADTRDAEQEYELDEAFLQPEQGVRMC